MHRIYLSQDLCLDEHKDMHLHRGSASKRMKTGAHFNIAHLRGHEPPLVLSVKDTLE